MKLVGEYQTTLGINRGGKVLNTGTYDPSTLRLLWVGYLLVPKLIQYPQGKKSFHYLLVKNVIF